MEPDMLDHLFRPLDLGPVTIPCRIVSTAHQTMLARGHVVSDELLAYHEARLRGGAGLIIMEAAAVEPSGLLSDTETMMAGYLPRTLDGYRQLKRLAAPYGAGVFVQPRAAQPGPAAGGGVLGSRPVDALPHRATRPDDRRGRRRDRGFRALRGDRRGGRAGRNRDQRRAQLSAGTVLHARDQRPAGPVR